MLFIGSSYVRFILNHDYMVVYEGQCDPTNESCFVGCNDENCISTYMYKNIYKKASNVLQQCGPDVTDCPKAQVCLESENAQDCYFEYCDPNSNEDCAVDSSVDSYQDENFVNESLPSNQVIFSSTSAVTS